MSSNLIMPYTENRWDNSLKYLAYQNNGGVQYAYEPVAIDNNIDLKSEEHYDNIAWYDAAPKPTWAEVSAVFPNALWWLLVNGYEAFENYNVVKYDHQCLIDKTQEISEILDEKFDTPTGTTSEYVRGDGTLATLPIASTLSFSNPTLTLNSGVQASTTRNAQVSVSIEQETTLSLSGGQTCTARFVYADNSGLSTNVVEIGRSVNGNTGTLTNITQTNTATIMGIIPAGKYYGVLTTGTGTQKFLSAQEVLL